MSTTENILDTLPAEYRVAAEKAGAASDAITDEHGRDWSTPGGRGCKCGRTFRRSQNLGLHLGAIERKAGKVWDAVYAATLIEERPSRPTCPVHGAGCEAWA